MARASTGSSGAAGALLREAEVQRLLLAASERAPTGVRNRALIALVYCSGLRIAEVLALRPDDVDLDAATIAVRGPRARTAHLFPAAAPYLETWLALRADLVSGTRAPLFCTLRGGTLAPAYVRAMLARLARRAGLGKRVHAQLLRHSCAARLARSGVSAQAIAEQLGHSLAKCATRALARFGVALPRTGLARAAEAAWSLAPEPGAVRAVVAGPARARATRARPGSVVVQRWKPPEL